MSNGQTELLAAVVRVVDVFNELNIDYLIGGSVASSIFGEPRQTIDADLVARLLGRHAQPLVDRLADEFYIDLQSINAAIQHQSLFNLIHLDTAVKIDVFVSWRSAFAQSQFNRRCQKIIEDAGPVSLYFASPEDIMLAKLESYKKGGCVSDRQWRDILGVAKVQEATLDRAYLTHWATELGVADLLNQALTDASG